MKSLGTVILPLCASGGTWFALRNAVEPAASSSRAKSPRVAAESPQSGYKTEDASIMIARTPVGASPPPLPFHGSVGNVGAGSLLLSSSITMA